MVDCRNLFFARKATKGGLGPRASRASRGGGAGIGMLLSDYSVTALHILDTEELLNMFLDAPRGQ